MNDSVTRARRPLFRSVIALTASVLTLGSVGLSPARSQDLPAREPIPTHPPESPADPDLPEPSRPAPGTPELPRRRPGLIEANPDGRLRAALGPILIRSSVPAIAVCVFNQDEVIATAQLGVRARGADASVQDGDLWHLGSCTKALTTTLLGSLVEAGKLRWDMTLKDALPEAAPTMHEKLTGVTLAQLVRHRAGLAAFTSGASPDFQMLKDLSGDPRAKRAAFAKALLALEPVVPPGTKQFYSNAGYAVAAAIAERAMDTSYEDLMAARVFTPLSIDGAGWGWPATPARPDQPRGHFPGLIGSTPQDLEPAYVFQVALAPAGDAHASIRGFAAFARAHLRGLRDHEGVLRAATIKALHEPEDGYAAGWVINTATNPPRHWHNGSAGTFFALMTVVPESNIGVVVATNSGEGARACEDATGTALSMFTGP